MVIYHVNLQLKVKIKKTIHLILLGFRIFRTSFIPKDHQIPILNDKIYEQISESYYGDHCDLYIPSNVNNENFIIVMLTLYFHYKYKKRIQHLNAKLYRYLTF